MILPTWTTEQKATAKGFTHVIGVDEVGRGPLVGPVVAAAAIAKDPALYDTPLEELYAQDKRWKLVRDSKKLSEKQRAEVVGLIAEHFVTAIGLCDHETIDRMNILEAAFLAMKKAVASLPREHVGEGTILLVDGDKPLPAYSGAQTPVVGGDAKVMTIAAASIVAKVARDEMIIALHEMYPQYGFDKHKGYGTKVHMDALRRYGPTPLHRKSFKPVRKILNDLRQHGADV